MNAIEQHDMVIRLYMDMIVNRPEITAKMCYDRAVDAVRVLAAKDAK
jgi:hypothetical protein